MNKKLLIGIIAGVVAVGAVIIGVLIGTSQNNAQNCKHEDPAKIVVVEAVAPTCQKTGLTEGKKCTNCGTMVLPQSIVQTIECIESDWIVDIAATHTEDGKHHTECTICGKLLREEVVLSGNKQLKYNLLDNGTYEVRGIGNCKDKNILIPSEYNGLSVTSISDYAFQFCTSLTSIVIPDSVTSIGEGAFAFCSSLASVTIPNSVTSIGDEAFSNCDSLTSITVDENNEYYKSIDGNLYTKDGKTLIQYARGKQATSFTIPDSVTSIGERAFYGCSSLTSVTIPNSVTSISDYAFKFCTSLTSIVIPDSVTSIGDDAFFDCKSLTSIEIPDSVTSIGDGAFYGCTSLTSIEIPNSVTSIGEYAFSYCSSLTSVTIPNSVTSISDYAFQFCTSLTIYCEASSKPSGWSNSWNSSNRPVVWGYMGE